MNDRAITAAAVANSFLDIQEADKSAFPPIDAMKLQKLLFYSHGWHLALFGTPLFVDEVYAWPWGPVIPNVYGEFRGFGRSPIVGKKATELIKNGPGVRNYRIGVPTVSDGQTLDFLRSVWNSHKHLNGIQLSNATHAPGEPWTIVKEQYGDLASKPLIPNDLIKEVFEAKRKANG